MASREKELTSEFMTMLENRNFAFWLLHGFGLKCFLFPLPSFSLGFQNKNRVAILAELDKEKRKLLMQNQSSASHPGARY